MHPFRGVQQSFNKSYNWDSQSSHSNQSCASLFQSPSATQRMSRDPSFRSGVPPLSACRDLFLRYAEPTTILKLSLSLVTNHDVKATLSSIIGLWLSGLQGYGYRVISKSSVNKLHASLCSSEFMFCSNVSQTYGGLASHTNSIGYTKNSLQLFPSLV